MFDAERLLGNLLQRGLSSSKAGRLTRSLGIPTGAGGVLTLLGGFAVAAYEHFSERQRQASPSPRAPRARRPESAAPPPPPGPATGAKATPPPPPPGIGGAASSYPTPLQPPDANKLAMTLIAAMIAAAKADGRIDADERRRILERLADASDEERAYVAAELDTPLDLDAVLAGVHGAEMAAEVYAVSLLAIAVDTPAEVAYLEELARRLGLERAAVERLHARVGAAPPARA